MPVVGVSGSGSGGGGGGCSWTAKITMVTAALVLLLLVGMYKIVNSAGGVVPLSYSSSSSSQQQSYHHNVQEGHSGALIGSISQRMAAAARQHQQHAKTKTTEKGETVQSSESPAEKCPNAINVSMAILLTPHFKSKGDLSVEMRPSIEAAGVLRASAERALYGSQKSPSSSSSSSDNQKRLATPNTLLTPNCKYRIHFIALITPKVKVHQPLLEFLGWKIVYAESPVHADEIAHKERRAEVLRDGAMGIDEMIKILAWKMTQYQSVVFVDVDIMFHKPFEELFELATVSSNSTDGGKTPNADAHTEIGLAWTRGGWESEKINGGFLVFYPHNGRSNKHFDRICNLLKEADFRSGSGWKGSGIGWTYGGRTLQGLLPYYFLKEAESHHYELERCRYNNMVQLPRCKAKKADEVTSNHFTGECLKPYTCAGAGHPLCAHFQKEWWKLADEVAKAKFGVEDVTACHGGHYPLMSKNWQPPPPPSSPPSS